MLTPFQKFLLQRVALDLALGASFALAALSFARSTAARSCGGPEKLLTDIAIQRVTDSGDVEAQAQFWCPGRAILSNDGPTLLIECEDYSTFEILLEAL